MFEKNPHQPVLNHELERLWLYLFSLIKINHLVWTIFQWSRKPSFLSGYPSVIYGNHQSSLQSPCCTRTLHTLDFSKLCQYQPDQMKTQLSLFSSCTSHGEHNMALVRGASSFWLKETVSTVWDSFFMGRYPDGSNEAVVLTTHLLKIPNHHQG